MTWTRRVLVTAGVGLMAYALFGAVTDPATEPLGQLAFLAAVVVAHDAVLVPLTIAVGVLIGRFVPLQARRSVRVAAICSLALTLMALPFVLGRGRRADDPSALPLDYGRGLLILLGIIWAAAVTVTVAGAISRRRTRDSPAR
jgi:hypothetical protein